MVHYYDANIYATEQRDGYAWLNASNVLQVVATLGAVAILSFLTKLVRHRRTFTRLQRQGLVSTVFLSLLENTSY